MLMPLAWANICIWDYGVWRYQENEYKVISLRFFCYLLTINVRLWLSVEQVKCKNMACKNITSLSQPNRNNVIQIVRAIAVIAVVMIHTCPSGEWQVYCRPFLNFSVATFLFLSGYLTKTENVNWPAFYKKRVTRVFIPYIVWTILYSLPSLINNGIGSLFKNLLTTHASAQLYYVFVYIQFVLLTPFLGKLANSKYRFAGWLIAPVSIIIFKYYSLITGVELKAYISLFWSDSCLGWFTFYYLGLILGNKIIVKSYSLTRLSIFYILSIMLQMGEGYIWLLLGEYNCGTQLKITSLLTSTLFLLIIYTILQQGKFEIKSNILRSLGDYSFGIYLCHIMVMKCMSFVQFYNIAAFPINSVITVVLSFLCCYIGHKVCGARISSWLGLK